MLDKYLKSRKDRELSLDEINHVGAVAESLAFTVERMVAIDTAYRAAFPEEGDSPVRIASTEPLMYATCNLFA